VNRERLLFVAVLAIVALWYFGIREAADPVRKADPRALEIGRVEPFGAELENPSFELPKPPPFTLVTNETPHPRPMDDPLFIPAKRDLPNLWPPTSRTVQTQYLGLLRRIATPPAEDDAASIELPAKPGAPADGDAAGGPTTQRVDQWVSNTIVNRGLVIAIRANGQWLRPKRNFPVPGRLPDYYRLLCLLEVNPGLAASMGVTRVEARFGKGSRLSQAFPAEITGFKIALEGKQQGWFIGARAYVRLPKEGHSERVSVANELIGTAEQRGTDRAILGWALHMLDEARKMVPESARNQVRQVLLLQLKAANLLNLQERVLQLGFEHLSRFREDSEVLEYMGDILSSRSFGLLELAAVFYERARSSKPAQQRRAGLLIEMGRFREAAALLDSGMAGSGPVVDLARARAALALADFKRAESLAGAHAGGGDLAAEANLILGGSAYAQGDAAGAQTYFEAAMQADPGRSAAFSDLGLALAVQGKAADAKLCFLRAKELDFENTVAPALGAIFPRLTFGLSPVEVDPNPRLRDPKKEAVQREARAAAMTEVVEGLEKIHADDPRNLLVRFYRAYAREKAGELEFAAKELRHILDEDHRYRIAIARLGIVQATRREAGGDKELVRPAIAHLYKATELNPKDATAAYILARFLMVEKLRRKDADRYFARAAQKELAPPSDPDLPLWAMAARASLLYRDESVPETKVKAAYSAVTTRIRDQGVRAGASDPEVYVGSHPCGRYAAACKKLVDTNSRKVDISWTFRREPRDWILNRKLPMKVGVTRNGLEFRGTVDFGGNTADHHTRLENCSAEYRQKLNGSNFFELHIKGVIPEGQPRVHVGFGLVGISKTRRSGRRGVQILRKDGAPRIRLEGGSDIEVIKRDRTRNYLPMEKVSWPAGEFELVIKVIDREKGLFGIWLNGSNIIQEQYGLPGARATVFGKGRGSRPIAVVIWVEGDSDEEFKGIVIKEVKLVLAGR